MIDDKIFLLKERERERETVRQREREREIPSNPDGFPLLFFTSMTIISPSALLITLIIIPLTLSLYEYTSVSSTFDLVTVEGTEKRLIFRITDSFSIKLLPMVASNK